MCNCLHCLTNNLTDSPPAKSQEMHLVNSQWSHQNLGPTNQELQFQQTPEELHCQHLANQSEEVKDVLPNNQPTSITHSVLPFNDVRPNRSSANFFDLRPDNVDPERVIEAKNNHNISTSNSTMVYGKNVLLANDPFNPEYELWEVIANRAKVRMNEHRKSKKNM